MKRILILILLITPYISLCAVSRLYESGNSYFQALGFSREGHITWQIIRGGESLLFRQDLITDETIQPFTLNAIKSAHRLELMPWGKKGYRNLKVHSVDIRREDGESDDLITGVRIIAAKNNREKELAVWNDLKVQEIRHRGYIKSPFENRLAVIIELISDQSRELRVVGCYGDISN